MKRKLFFIVFTFLVIKMSASTTIENNSEILIEDSIEMLACTPPTVTHEIVPNCAQGEQFLIDVIVSDLGSAENVVVEDNMGSTPQTISTAETITFGPYPNGVEVTIIVSDEDDSSCKDETGELTQLYCPTDYISVSDSYSAEELVTEVLIDNPCAMVSNVTSSTGTDFSDGTPGLGYFSGENTTCPIGEGIILSSGDVNNASGPEQETSDGGNDWPGDDDLDDLVSSQGSTGGTHNASVIEFDFVPYTDQISFNYLFASSEYGTFQCSYADVFGFFLTDEDGNTTNLAVVPDTDTPVSVTTIRDNTYNSTCESMNEEYFDSYYGINGLPSEADPISFKGYTVELTAEAEVVPGQTYHIKLAIADYLDTSYDSAVFVQAGSFELGTIDLGPDLTVDNQNAPCEENIAILDAGIEDNDLADISWYKDNEIIEGATSPILEVTESGTYAVFVIYGGTCVIDDEIYVEFAPVPNFDFDQEEENLCGVDTVVLDGTPSNIDDFGGGEISYTWYLDGDEISGENNATIEVNEPGTYEVEVTTGLDCVGTHVIEVSDADFDIDLGEDLVFCDIEDYELTAEIEGDTSGAVFEWEGPGIEEETGQSVVVTQSGTYTVYVTIENCTANASIDIEFEEPADFDLGSDIFTPDLEDLFIDATPTNIDPDDANYEWEYNENSIPENGPIVYLEDYGYGTYTVTVYADDPDCFSSQSIEVTEEEIICEVVLTADKDLTAEIGYCEGDDFNAYEIIFTAEFSSENAQGDPTYIWSVNGEEVEETEDPDFTLIYDDEGEFNDEVSVEVIVDNCSASTTAETNVLVSPYEHPCVITEGISPGNNDGNNDYLDLTFLNDRSGIEKITIYNRYGSKVFDQNNYSDEWRGQDNGGKELPSSTYYYVIKLKNEDPVFDQVIKGWIYVNQDVN